VVHRVVVVWDLTDALARLLSIRQGWRPRYLVLAGDESQGRLERVSPHPASRLNSPIDRAVKPQSERLRGILQVAGRSLLSPAASSPVSRLEPLGSPSGLSEIDTATVLYLRAAVLSRG
jgi:hypothetical protein